VKLVSVAGFDPAASRFRTECSTKLSYTLKTGALCGERSRLTTVTGWPPHLMRNSANWCVWLDSNEHCTASRTAPSAIGVQTRMMEDQAGFEPAMGASHRIKSPTRSATTVTGPDLEDAVGLEPTMRAEAQRG
jgi:hypothetical protein